MTSRGYEGYFVPTLEQDSQVQEGCIGPIKNLKKGGDTNMVVTRAIFGDTNMVVTRTLLDCKPYVSQ